MLTAIVDNLAQQKNAYSHILSLSMQEQLAIVASDAPRVQELARQVMEGMVEAADLEDERKRLVGRFLLGRGEPPRDLSLGELRALADPQTARSLEKTGRELVGVLAEQKRVNDLNRDLLQLHFHYINFMIDAFAQSAQQAQPNNLYNAGGREDFSAPQSLGILDSQI